MTTKKNKKNDIASSCSSIDTKYSINREYRVLGIGLLSYAAFLYIFAEDMKGEFFHTLSPGFKSSFSYIWEYCYYLFTALGVMSFLIRSRFFFLIVGIIFLTYELIIIFISVVVAIDLLTTFDEETIAYIIVYATVFFILTAMNFLFAGIGMKTFRRLNEQRSK